jgi:hypothetical protein
MDDMFIAPLRGDKIIDRVQFSAFGVLIGL